MSEWAFGVKQMHKASAIWVISHQAPVVIYKAVPEVAHHVHHQLQGKYNSETIVQLIHIFSTKSKRVIKTEAVTCSSHVVIIISV